MERVRLGSSDLEVSRVALGCWAIGGHGWGQVDPAESVATIRAAYEAGVDFFDTADCYGLGRSEELLAEALGEHRTRVVIATKGGVRWNDDRKTWHDCSPDYLRRALEASLRRLRLDSIPLYYVHWPDGRTGVEEVVAVLAREKEKGTIRCFGLSNHSAAQVRQAAAVGNPAALQLKCSLMDRSEADVLVPEAIRNHLGVVAWGTLGQGLLTGKFNEESHFDSDDHRSRNPDFAPQMRRLHLGTAERLRAAALRLGVSPAQLAIRWVLDMEGVSCAVVGAKRPQQVAENLGAAGWRLSREDWEELAGLGRHHGGARP